MSILSDIDIIVEMKRYLHGIDLNLKKNVNFFVHFLTVCVLYLTNNGGRLC